jgi:uncharacterized membrane protein HdeD (DUF308 family)
MLHGLTRKWGLTLAIGICTTLLGAIAILYPRVALAAVLAGCALYWCVDGIQSVALGMSMRHARTRLSWQLIISGALSIAAAVFTIAWPRLSVMAVVFIVAIWAIAIGISEIATAIHLRKYIRREWLFYALGVFSIVFGVAVMLQPVEGIQFFVWMLGVFALVRGTLLCAFAMELRGIRRAHLTTHHPPFASHVGR